VYPLANLRRIRALADELGLAVHMDGARVFNAATALGVPVKEITQYVDSVTFCLSKSLGAPVGSLVCGPKDFIATARRFRRMLGGGLRQAGIIAAAGIVALQTIPPKLAQDHANAKRLGEGLATVPGISVEPVETNMVFLTLAPELGPVPDFLQALAARGVRCGWGGGRRLRMVTYHQISPQDIETAIVAVAETVANLRQAAVAGRTS
jgi:threonine aldolase